MIRELSLRDERGSFEADLICADYREKLTLDPSSERRLFGGEFRARHQAEERLIPGESNTVDAFCHMSDTGSTPASMFRGKILLRFPVLPI